MSALLPASFACLALFFLSMRAAARRRSAAGRRLAGAQKETGAAPGRSDSLARRLGAGGRGAQLREALEASGLPVTWNAFCALWGLALLAVPAAAFMLTGSVVAIPLSASAVLAVPGPVLKALRRLAGKKASDRCDRLAADLALYLRCGIPVEAALSLCAEGAGPVLPELARARSEVDLGVRADAALLEMATDLDSPDLGLIARAAMTSRETGADVRGVMDAVGEAVRDRASIRRELAGQTVQGRMSGRIVAALPFLFLGMSALLSRDTARVLFGTTPGLIMLCVGGALDAAGFLWMRRILDIKM
ncbi:MAG: type II secretion system F family protein [Actinobacteria bacterium]|nr:type II secretion system F family protein [Actinomycetota bacterium]MBU1942508.1 type II secretion system F family protein [Actinomycetota bacterium]MBU2687236.1 type II secretion system F family protein [Actinomycetota bacterium]